MVRKLLRLLELQIHSSYPLLQKMSSQESESESSPTRFYSGFNSGSQYDDPSKSSSSEDEGDDPSSDNDSVQQHQGKKRTSSFGTEQDPFVVKKARFGDPRPSYSADTASDSNALYSAQSRRMMDMMNYDKSKGLGKSGQGRLDIVEIAQQKGRRGLGKCSPSPILGISKS